MVITRKIEVFICEDDKELRRAYYDKLYANRDIAVKVANMAMSHLFALDNTMPYLSDEDKETITFLGVKGNKATKQNAPYVAASQLFKGQADMGMVSCVLQNAQKMYQDDRKKGMWNKSLRSYKSNMPVPFKADRFLDLRFAEYEDKEGKKREGCFFTLMGIPFQCRFGRDRSGNRLIVERVISGEYKMCTSSIQVDGRKVFLMLCVDIPQKEVKLKEDKTLYAFLGVMNPIVCTCDVRAAKEYDSGMKTFEIGTAEEFNYRRRQIQEAVRRCQINNRYSVGGKGRKKKCQAIDRWHDKENNYVDTKLHTYSRLLVDLAVKHSCGKIVLMNQTHREDDAKSENAEGDNFVLRNWTYYGLKEKIAYKCKMYGIKMEVQK
jgi:IS605 OrfB family transposase